MSNLATTKQVRKIMREHGRDSIWTNCYDKHSNVRHVKCYARRSGPYDLMVELAEAAGHENVWLTTGDQSYFGGRAVIVRCKLEK